MLAPSKQKFRKRQKGRLRGKASRGFYVAYGDFGLASSELIRLTQRQIEAARIAMTRFIKRAGRIWCRVFPDMPVTSKPAETRMGKGKGAPERFEAWVQPGRILFEMQGVPIETVKEAFRLASHKLPMHTVLVSREDRL